MKDIITKLILIFLLLSLCGCANSRGSDIAEARRIYKENTEQDYYNSNIDTVYYRPNAKDNNRIIYTDKHGAIERDAYGPGMGMDECGRRVRVRAY